MKSSIIKCNLERLIFHFLRLILGRKKRDQYFRKKEMKRNAALVQKYGTRALRIFSEIITNEEKSYWLFAGTLLGAYRDKGFIKHDEDIDVGMYDYDITISLLDKMIEKGFKCLEIVVDKDYYGGCQLGFDFMGVKFDIYSFHKNSNNTLTVFAPVPFNYAKWGKAKRTDIFDIIHITVDKWENLMEICFEGIKTIIPSNADDVLKTLYGEDYLITVVGYKVEQKLNKNIVHEDPQKHYGCLMSYEVFKMVNDQRLSSLKNRSL